MEPNSPLHNTMVSLNPKKKRVGIIKRTVPTKTNSMPALPQTSPESNPYITITKQKRKQTKRKLVCVLFTPRIDVNDIWLVVTQQTFGFKENIAGESVSHDWTVACCHNR